jgi:hypothetical protein
MVEISVFLAGVAVGLLLGLLLARTRRTETIDPSTLGTKLFLGGAAAAPAEASRSRLGRRVVEQKIKAVVEPDGLTVDIDGQTYRHLEDIPDPALRERVRNLITGLPGSVTDPDAYESLDRGADRPEHPPELTLPALCEDRPVPHEGHRSRVEQCDEPPVFDGGLGSKGLGEPGQTLIELDAPPQRRDLSLVERSREADRVFALDAVTRVQDPLRPLAVVGEQQQPLRVLVEAAHRIEPSTLRHERGGNEIEDSRSRVSVPHRGGDAGRLVQREMDMCGGARQRSPVDEDRRELRVDLLAERRDTTIDGHPTGHDEILAPPA